MQNGTCTRINNSPPEVEPAEYSYEVSGGGVVRVTLDAGLCTDVDSTPGTNDNIREYRWYDESGSLLGTGKDLVVELVDATNP